MITVNLTMANYTDLVDNEIDVIDAAVFSGDLFMNNKNRSDFRDWMGRWERQMIAYDDIDKHNKEQ